MIEGEYLYIGGGNGLVTYHIAGDHAKEPVKHGPELVDTGAIAHTSGVDLRVVMGKQGKKLL